MTPAALLNHLWQSTAFLAAAAAVCFLLRRHQARVRFWVWMAASLKFLVPFSLLAALGGSLRWASAPALAATPALTGLSQPFCGGTIIWLDGEAASAAAASLPWLLPLLAALALAGSGAVLLRWAMRWRRLAQVARAGVPARMADVEVRLTAAAIEPGVFGIRRPVVLLPERLSHDLSAAQLSAVLAHEGWHVRRRDNLWAALHMLVEALFWFFPPVWWLGARLVAERERACDEAVLRDGRDRAIYAESLLAVCRYYLASPLACAAGVSGGGLAARVRAIVAGGWARSLGRGRRWLLYGLASLALAGPIALGLLAAQTAPAPIAFEAISIRPSAPPSASGGGMTTFRMGVRLDPLHLTATNTTLAMLLQQAYHLKPYQLVVPDWMNSERFDIQAVVAKPATREQMVALLGPYLEKQFQIQSHRDTKTMPIYALTVLPGGFKAKPASPDDVPHYFEDAKLQAEASREVEAVQKTMTTGSGGAPPKGAMMIAFSPGGAFRLVGIGGLDRLVDMLSQQVDRPVINDTGIQGTYDLELSFLPPPNSRMMINGLRLQRARGTALAAAPAAAGRGAASSPAPAAEAPAPSLFDALQQQLGLKLEQKQGPVERLVVDHANQKPIGN